MSRVVLNLGVNDIYYAGKGGTESKTTGDVADILEAKYHIMRIFFELHSAEIADFISEGLKGTMENMMLGAPLAEDPFGDAMEKTEELFRKFLSEGELEAMGYPGIPTKAALEGISHRLQHPYARTNPKRMSFIDTGLFEANFRAWISEDD